MVSRNTPRENDKYKEERGKKNLPLNSLWYHPVDGPDEG